MISIKKGALSLCIFFTAHSMQLLPAKHHILRIASTARLDEIKTLKLLPSFAQEYGVAAVLGIEWISTICAYFKSKGQQSSILIAMIIAQSLYFGLLTNLFNSPSWLLAAVYLVDHLTRCIHICRHYNSVPYASAYAVSNIAYYFLRDVEDAIICKLWVILFVLSHVSTAVASYRMLRKRKVAAGANTPPEVVNTPPAVVNAPLTGKQLKKAQKNYEELADLNRVAMGKFAAFYPTGVKEEKERLEEEIKRLLSLDKQLLTEQDDKDIVNMIHELEDANKRIDCARGIECAQESVKAQAELIEDEDEDVKQALKEILESRHMTLNPCTLSTLEEMQEQLGVLESYKEKINELLLVELNENHKKSIKTVLEIWKACYARDDLSADAEASFISELQKTIAEENPKLRQKDIGRIALLEKRLEKMQAEHALDTLLGTMDKTIKEIKSQNGKLFSCAAGVVSLNAVTLSAVTRKDVLSSANIVINELSEALNIDNINNINKEIEALLAKQLTEEKKAALLSKQETLKALETKSLENLEAARQAIGKGGNNIIKLENLKKALKTLVLVAEEGAPLEQ